jgi:hypothetical protein
LSLPISSGKTSSRSSDRCKASGLKWAPKQLGAPQIAAAVS